MQTKQYKSSRTRNRKNSTKDWNWNRIRKRILVKDCVWISCPVVYLYVRMAVLTVGPIMPIIRTYVLFILNRMSRLRYEMNENVKFKMTRIRKIPHDRIDWILYLFTHLAHLCDTSYTNVTLKLKNSIREFTVYVLYCIQQLHSFFKLRDGMS